MPTTSPTVLAQMIESYTHAYPSPTPLTPIIHTLFDASLSTSNNSTADLDPSPITRRFLTACSHLPTSISHAGISGPLSGPHALHMQIRKSSVWTPSPPSTANESTVTAPSLADEMRRTAIDRQRRREFVHWARLHAAMLEIGPWITTDRDHDDSRSCSPFSDYTFLDARAFSELIARDAVWEADEVQWVAGVLILRALIRTAALPAGVSDLFPIHGCMSPRGRVGRSLEYYGSLLRRYESRWKEIKDETRQAIVVVGFPSRSSDRVADALMLGSASGRERETSSART